MSKKDIVNNRLSIIESGRITDKQMDGITGGARCVIYIRCDSQGKNSCGLYKKCSWFLNKTTCDSYSFVIPA